MTPASATKPTLSPRVKDAFLAAVEFIGKEKVVASLEFQGYGLILCGILTLAHVLEDTNAAEKR